MAKPVKVTDPNKKSGAGFLSGGVGVLVTSWPPCSLQHQIISFYVCTLYIL